MRKVIDHILSLVLGFFHRSTAVAVSGSLVANFRPIGGGEQTAELKTRLTELKTAAKAVSDENQTIAGSATVQEIEVADPDNEGQTMKVKATYIDRERQERFDANMKTLREELRPEIERIEQMLELSEWGETPKGSVAAQAAAAAAVAAAGGSQRPQRKTLGQQFVESEEFKEMVTARKATMDRPFVYKGLLPDPILTKDVYGTLPGGDSPWQDFGQVQNDPFVEARRRTFRVRDLFPVQRTTASTIRYFRVLGYLMDGGATNAASTVGQRNEGNTAFASKPHTNLKFSPRVANDARIAHYEIAHRDVLDDEPQLRGIIDAELLYGLQIREDAQILYGTGTGNDLDGIFSAEGIQEITQGTAPSDSDDNVADVLRRAMTLTILAEFESTGVVLHPTDLEDLELLRSDGDERFYLFAATIQQGGEPRVWRVPVVQTPAIEAKTGLVGAFGLGAQLYDREEANIRVSEHHDKLFVENGVAILAEERLLQKVSRPEAFVKVTIAAD